MRYYIDRTFPALLDFDNFFNDFFSSGENRFPPVDVYEREKEYVIEAEVPGYDESEIKIYCKNRVLTISCARPDEEASDGYLVNEISRPSFSRSFQLPRDADEDSVEAVSRNGILTITISRAKEEKKRISVKIN